MKKRIALVLTLMFTLTAFAAFAETSEETEAPEAADAPSKTLVVYFSATGSTERIAHMIAAETEKAARKAMGLIKVKYQLLEPVLDFRTAKDNPVLVRRL